MSHPVPGHDYYSHEEERAHSHRTSDKNSIRARLKKAAPTIFGVARSQDRHEEKKTAKNKALAKKTGEAKKPNPLFDTDAIRKRHGEIKRRKLEAKEMRNDTTGDPYYENR